MLRILINSTTADAADVNDNFYHIGKGSVMPMAGDYLRPTDSACDLGTAAYKWNNAFIDNIDCSTVSFSGSITCDRVWILLHEVDSLNDSITSRMEFSVSGHEYNEFYINFISIISSANQKLLFFNGDSSTAYTHIALGMNSSGLLSENTSAKSGIRLDNPNVSTTPGVTRVHVSGKSGNSRVIFTEYCNSVIRGALFGNCLWKNTSDAITSLTFTNLATSTSIRIYAR